MLNIKIFKKNKLSNFENLPVHIAIIPDGNGRWAKKRGLPRSTGHRQGSDSLKQIVKYCAKIGIKYLTTYVFSTENWKRPKEEVDSLMNLLQEFLSRAHEELSGSNIRINVIGDTTKLSKSLSDEILKVEDMTRNNTGLQFNIALNYGGRDEIISAIKKICQDVKDGKLEVDSINEKVVSSKLYTYNIPDPDLVIRTAGEKRISNFLLWQLAYSELWISDVLWPDFTEQHLIEAINEYQKRERRYGGL